MAEQNRSDTQSGIASELWQVLGRHRWRIGAALVLLLVAKLATVAVPLLLKRKIDTFQGGAGGHPPLVLPVGLLAGYAVLRFSSTLFNELRDLLFSTVTLGAVSGYAQRTFAHLRPPARAGAAFPRAAQPGQPAARHRPRHERHRLSARGGAVHHRADPGRDRPGAGHHARRL